MIFEQSYEKCLGFRHAVSDKGMKPATLSRYLRDGLARMQVWQETCTMGFACPVCTSGLGFAWCRHSVSVWMDPIIDRKHE